MTTYFVTRHKGAVEWARGRGIKAQHIEHLDPDTIKPGDVVLGTLPVSVAAQVCTRGAKYLHLSLKTPPKRRGQELSAEDMDELGAELIEYEIRRV